MLMNRIMIWVKNIRNAGAFDCAAVERYGITRKNEEEYKMELEVLRKGNSFKKEISLNEVAILDIFESNTFELNINFKDCDEFKIELREDCNISFSNGVFKLQLGKSGYGRNMRAVEINNVKSLRVFSDNSSLEVFLNEGEEVFTTRIYNDKIDSKLKLSGSGTVEVEKWAF